MFRCEVTRKCSAPGERPRRVVVETRRREYVNDEGKVSRGWEIVREVFVSERGWDLLQKHARGTA